MHYAFGVRAGAILLRGADIGFSPPTQFRTIGFVLFSKCCAWRTVIVLCFPCNVIKRCTFGAIFCLGRSEGTRLQVGVGLRVYEP